MWWQCRGVVNVVMWCDDWWWVREVCPAVGGHQRAHLSIERDGVGNTLFAIVLNTRLYLWVKRMNHGYMVSLQLALQVNIRVRSNPGDVCTSCICWINNPNVVHGNVFIYKYNMINEYELCYAARRACKLPNIIFKLLLKQLDQNTLKFGIGWWKNTCKHNVRCWILDS